jgi:two-component system, NarL family, response regulator NreC
LQVKIKSRKKRRFMNVHLNPLKTVKILIVDDHALIRKGIMALLKDYNPGWELHEAEDGVKAIVKAQEVDPDIILLDYHMPKLDGLKTTTIIKRSLPESKIIIVTMDMNPEMVTALIDVGVAGIVSKQSPDNELILAIDTVKSGKRHLSEFASKIITQKVIEKKQRIMHDKHTRSKLLTDREIEVLKYLVKGYSCPVIAKTLSLSYRTVENHKANLFRKCKVSSIIELARIAIKMKIIHG